MNRSIVQSRTSIFWDVRPTIFLINLQLEDFDLKKCYFLLLRGEKGNNFVCYFFWFKKSIFFFGWLGLGSGRLEHEQKTVL